MNKNLYYFNNHLLRLTKLIDIGKLPKVLMLSGQKGQGKFTLVHHFLSYIFDKNNYDLENSKINEKNKLFKDIKENYNSNIIYFNCGEKKIKIDDIRNLRIELQKSSINNYNRYIIFDDAEYLNDNCVNALLKTIEEPSTINYFILINNKNQKILDTLKSRSIEIMFFLNNDEKSNVIKKIISDFEIENKIDINNTTLTPGSYLSYNKIILEEKIDLNDELIINIDKLLKLNKQKKNISYFSLAIHLINQYYFNKSKDKSNTSVYNDKRISIIKKINESNKLNLNHINLIAEIESYI
tara:strand:+ start:1476 stop:2366 length:891 start_codon:yes stop_codon:yes gene_type:complete